MIAGPLLSRAADYLLETVKPSIVAVEQARGFGAGVIWNAEGIVITNDHVARQDRARVTLHDGRSFAARVIARDPRRDLAALTFEADRITPIKANRENKLEVGQLMMALGHPLGRRDHVSFGIVSASSDSGLLHLDIPLAPGNSGGPIFDADANMVGVAQMVAAPGIGLAIPVQAVRDFVAKVTGFLRVA